MSDIIVSVLISVAVIAMLALYVRPLWATRKARGVSIADLPDYEIAGLEQARLLYFYAPVCGMCRNMTPVIQRLMQQRQDIISIDASEKPGLARSLGVMGTPACVWIKQGRVSRVRLGVLSEADLMSSLKPENA
ncbi:MAG: thioredoxin family protein [gamma proteobacterium symbiont of Bathyaustriella thionipta]|nr:thioredoxin family protein [gamma proteobacterium symbiont of Bathyaustriella thionipta]